jgi:hypothetical protein
MQNLAAIAALYNEIDAEFERQRAHALAAQDGAAATRIEGKQSLNDQAYFILCWGQLETAIDDTCREAIRRGRQISNWAIRRAWDLYNPDDRRLSGLSLEERAALVLNRNEDHWRSAIEYYNLRNQIAHGRVLARRIDVPKVIAAFYTIQGALMH